MATNFIRSRAISSLRREPAVLVDTSSMNSSVGTRMLGSSSSILRENKCVRKMIAEQEASQELRRSTKEAGLNFCGPRALCGQSFENSPGTMLRGALTHERKQILFRVAKEGHP